MQTSLRESEARYRSVIAAMAEGVVIIGKDGRVVLAGWTLSLPTTIQPNTTLSCYKQVQWILPNGDGWTAEKPVRFYTGVRADYDNVSVGSDGDPDMVYGIMQGNVAMWEGISTYLPERLAPMRLFHGSITYLTLLFLVIGIDPLLPF